ncbi:hypothetical protein PCANC_20288 [Puccinia coronata f. sp. avenae]|uniref:Uncharacterized protein n=1 Tax=Puccinia coronata f. sp. avenae TaxID=200324 RepID=A0A2N5UMI6_9BASI|nr:hypothetical protein PCANC_20288 [Puccinia coronata f. sp. avenae]
MASSCMPEWRAALWVEFPASAGAHLPAFPRTCLPSRLYILLSKLAATCSASRLQPALQAGCNLLAKQAETCLPTRLQATGGGQVRFPGNRTGASHSKSWLKSDSPGIGLGGRQQRQRLLSSSSLQKQQRPLAAALGPRQRPLLSRGQEDQHGSFFGWPKQAPVQSLGIRTGASQSRNHIAPAVAGSCPIPQGSDWAAPGSHSIAVCNLLAEQVADCYLLWTGASQSRNHIAPAVAGSCPIPQGSDWAAPSGHCIAVCKLLTKQVAVCNLLAKQVAVCNLLAKQVAVCNLLAKQVAFCNLLAEQVAVCNLLAEQVAVCNLLAKQVAVCNLLAKQVAVCNLLAKQVAVCNLLAEQVAVCNLLAKQVAVCNLLAKQVAVCNLLAKQVAVCNLLAEQVAVCNLLAKQVEVCNPLEEQVAV